MADDLYRPGLEGVIAGESSVSTVQGGLTYRGYPIEELAQRSTFEEVAYLILYGELPKADELKAFQRRLANHAAIPSAAIEMLRHIPAARPSWMSCAPARATSRTATLKWTMPRTKRDCARPSGCSRACPTVLAARHRLARQRACPTGQTSLARGQFALDDQPAGARRGHCAGTRRLADSLRRARV